MKIHFLITLTALAACGAAEPKYFIYGVVPQVEQGSPNGKTVPAGVIKCVFTFKGVEYQVNPVPLGAFDKTAISPLRESPDSVSVTFSPIPLNPKQPFVGYESVIVSEAVNDGDRMVRVLGMAKMAAPEKVTTQLIFPARYFEEKRQ